jgi:hypothetical protein
MRLESFIAPGQFTKRKPLERDFPIKRCETPAYFSDGKPRRPPSTCLMTIMFTFPFYRQLFSLR